MTEKEKAQAGMLYNNNYDKELVSERRKCQKKCQEYNSIEVDDLEARQNKIKDIVGSIVTKDIPSGVIAAGNPCRIIKTIDPEDLEYK